MTENVNLMSNSNKKYVVAVYVLQSLFFVGLLFTPVMGIVLNYIKYDDVKGSWLESHFKWQKNTFWFGLLWYVIASFFFLIFGWLVLLVATIWYFYRIAKGWIYFADGKEMYS